MVKKQPPHVKQWVKRASWLAYSYESVVHFQNLPKTASQKKKYLNSPTEVQSSLCGKLINYLTAC